MRATLGQYIARKSPIHDLDARVKLFLMALGIGVSFRLDSLVAVAGFVLSLIAFTMLSRIPLKDVERGLRPFVWLFAVTAVLHVFMTPGDAIGWFPLATKQGLAGGARVAVQLVCAIWISTLATLTTPALDIVWALQWYMRPLGYLGVPTGEISLAVMLAIRFIPLLFDEASRIIKAQKARGVDMESASLAGKIRAMVPVVVPLMNGVLRKADDLAIALTLRGYEPGRARSRRKVTRIGPGDVCALVGTGIWFCLLAAF